MEIAGMQGMKQDCVDQRIYLLRVSLPAWCDQLCGLAALAELLVVACTGSSRKGTGHIGESRRDLDAADPNRGCCYYRNNREMQVCVTQTIAAWELSGGSNYLGRRAPNFAGRVAN